MHKQNEKEIETIKKKTKKKNPNRNPRAEEYNAELKNSTSNLTEWKK